MHNQCFSTSCARASAEDGRAAVRHLQSQAGSVEAGGRRGVAAVRTSLAFIALVALLAVGGSQALANGTAPGAKTVTVVMRDPGCHWFAVNGKYLKTLTAQGPVKLANY